MSNHGSECEIMEVSVKSWKRVSNHGSECQIMEVSVKLWKCETNYNHNRRFISKLCGLCNFYTGVMSNSIRGFRVA